MSTFELWGDALVLCVSVCVGERSNRGNNQTRLPSCIARQVSWLSAVLDLTAVATVAEVSSTSLLSLLVPTWASLAHGTVGRAFSTKPRKPPCIHATPHPPCAPFTPRTVRRIFTTACPAGDMRSTAFRPPPRPTRRAASRLPNPSATLDTIVREIYYPGSLTLPTSQVQL